MRLPLPSRRRFLQTLGGGGAGLAAGIGLYAWRIEPHWLEFVHRDLPIADLPDDLVDRTLVQLSDLHVGPRVDADYLTRSLGRVNALGPDLVVITGDFMSCYDREQIDEAIRVVSHLDRPPLGCFAILGNHDYGEGYRRVAVADELCDRLARLGVEPLRNAATDVRGLRMIGLDDLWGPHFHPWRVERHLAAPGPSLVLCHNPDAADLPVWAGYRGWILSGHTHGGQCKAPFLPPPLLPVRNKRYTAGEFDLGDGRRMYINRALGYLQRVRFNVRPEVTVFRLRRAT